MRTPLVVMVVLAVGLLGLWLLTEESEESRAAPRAASVTTISQRVEQLRDLRFEEQPDPVTVTSDHARREGLEDLDRNYPPARLAADQEIYTLLGLIEPGTDLREVSGSLFGEGVAGYYDPRDGRLRVVEGAGTGNRVLEEMVLAHELTHALEDQRFGLPAEPAASDDRSLARSALFEGTATALMYAYVGDHFSAEETLSSLVGSAFEDTGDLPPFIQAQVLFSYLAGERFVSNLIRRAGGGWQLVDTAYEVRRPSSTEQILHPAAYFGADEPRQVRIDARPGPGWRRVHAGTWGELQTRELLDGDGEAAAGWGGDRYELWQSGEHSELIMRWVWDTPRDVDQFEDRLREVLGSRGTITRRGRAVTLVVRG